MKPEKRKKEVISQAFQIMVHNYTITAIKRPQTDYTNYQLLNSISPNIQKVKQVGLIASNPMMTSRALRAVTCGGNVEKLIGTDGRSFENVIGGSHVELYFEHIAKKASSTGKHTLP